MTSLKHLAPLGVAVVCASSLVGSPPARAAVSVLDPSATIAGVSQEKLSQQWWNWAASFPVAASPLSDTTGAFSYLGNQGSVFFLAGTSLPNAAERNVTVHSDQTIFFPLINSVDGYSDAQIAKDPTVLTDSFIRSETTNFFGNASGLFLKLNGSDLALPSTTKNLLAFRQPTGKFDLVLPSDDNIFGGPPLNPADTYRSFSDGYWIGLAPLANGHYDLHYGGSSLPTGPFAGNSFSQDVTYHVTVVPEPGSMLMMLAGLMAVAAIVKRGRAA